MAERRYTGRLAPRYPNLAFKANSFWERSKALYRAMAALDTIRSEVADEPLVIICSGASALFNGLFGADNPG
jgi:hypothetical protein